MPTFEFGPFVLDPAKRVLLREGGPQYLSPKAFDVLLLLVERRERVLSKEELLSTLWPDTFVEEANLSQQIFVLRRTLNGDADGLEYITTFPRHGYRFTANVIERSDPEIPTAPPAIQQSQGRSRWRVPSLIGMVLLGAAVLFGVVRRAPPVGSDPRITTVTALPGLEQFPSISPDGNFVAFSWTGSDPAGVPDIWIKAIDSDDLRQLTDTRTAEFRPAWSPDGREIAFLRAGEGVVIASALSGQERKVATSGSIVGWTPDGRSLLVRDRTGDKPYGIFRLELDSGTRYQLTQAPSGVGDWTFDVSPDGKTLAFVRYERPGVSDLYVMPLEGGNARRRTNWNATISGLAWMPDGRHILYSVDEATGLDESLFKIPADGEQLDRGVRVIRASVATPSLSRPGPGKTARLAFTARRVDVGLRLVDLKGSSSQGVFESVMQFSDSTRIDYPGRFSRDGRRVAFSSTRTGPVETWVANADGSGSRQVTALQATELLVGEWSPDDRRLVIDAAIAGNSDVYVVSLGGGPPVRLTTEAAFDGLAHWSADGRWIYFSSDRSGRVELWKMPADGGRAVQVTREGGVQPAEAPDGRTLFYLDRAGERGRIKQVPVEGGDEVVVLENVRLGLWSVTSDGIIFLTIEQESDELDFYSFSDRRVRRLGKLPFRASRIAGLGGLITSRDGRWALVSATDHWESDIMIADGVR